MIVIVCRYFYKNWGGAAHCIYDLVQCCSAAVVRTRDCSIDTDKLYYRHQLQPTAVQHCLVEAARCFDAFLDPHSRATLNAGNTNCWMAPVNDWQFQNKAWMGVWGSTHKISNVNINNQMGGLEVCKELSPGVKECRDSVASGKYTRPHSGSWAPHHSIKPWTPCRSLAAAQCWRGWVRRGVVAAVPARGCWVSVPSQLPISHSHCEWSSEKWNFYKN